MGGSLGRIVGGYNDDNDDDMPVGVELVAQNERDNGEEAVEVPVNEAGVLPALSPLLFGGNVFPNGDPANPVHNAMLPLLRRLASNMPQLSHTRTVTCPFNVNKSSVKLVPRKTTSSDTSSSIIYDIQFTLDATEPCTVRVFFCVDEIFSNGSFEYKDASTGSTIGSVPSSPVVAPPSAFASSSSSSPNIGYIEKKFGVGLGQTFFTLGSEALDITKYSISDLIWNQLEQQLEVDKLHASSEDGDSESEASDDETDAQEGEEDENADGSEHHASDDESADTAAIVDEEAGTTVVRRRRRHKRAKKLPAMPRPLPVEKPSVRNLFPLVIVAEPTHNEEFPNQKPVVEAQITHLCLVRKQEPSPALDSPDSPDSVAASSSSGDLKFESKLLRQKLLVNGAVYNVYEIFGVEQDSGASANSSLIDGGLQSTCVICMSEPRTTLVIPCRHMCLCEDCAETLKVQSVKCPICRGPVRTLLKIDINENGDDDDDEKSKDEENKSTHHNKDASANRDHDDLHSLSEEEEDDDDHSVHTSLVKAAK